MCVAQIAFVGGYGLYFLAMTRENSVAVVSQGNPRLFLICLLDLVVVHVSH